jgi:hypothetical protein
MLTFFMLRRGEYVVCAIYENNNRVGIYINIACFLVVFVWLISKYKSVYCLFVKIQFLLSILIF